MDRPRLFSIVLVVLTFLVVAFPLFWIEGGLTWLDTKVFPPRPPKGMPANAVWINAPSLPISWHHGWWFGCGLAQSGAANYCRLVSANGDEVYAGEYLPCQSKTPLPLSTEDLVAPRQMMWTGAGHPDTFAPIGVLRSGDLLLPVAVLDRCDKLKENTH